METKTAVKTVITISYKMIILALVIMLIYYAGGAAFRFGVAVFNEKAKDTSDGARTVTVTIPDNPTVRQVAKSVDEAGAVDGEFLFYVQAMLSDYRKYFVGGTFEVSTDMTPTEIMAAITQESREEAATQAASKGTAK